MLQVKNVNLTHKKDSRILLQDFSCAWNRGDKAVLIGEEGNGKSTLLRWIYDPESVEQYMEAEGTRIVSGERMGYLPQELPEEEKGKTLYEFFSEEPQFFEQTPGRLGLLAKEFHVPADFYYRDQLMETLSGGEKVKVQIMRVWLTEPTVLLLDEPTNNMDIGTLEWMERMIRDFAGIVLFISHDETLIERTANMVIHMEQLRHKSRSRCTVARIPYVRYRQERSDRFEKQEQQAKSERRERRIQEEKFRRIQQRVEYEQATISRQDPAGGRLLKKKMHAVKSLERRYEREQTEMTERPESEDAIFFKLGEKEAAVPAGKTVLEYSLEKLYTPDGSRVLAKNIFLRVRGPEKICIIGENGCGKTTLLRKIREELLSRDDIQAAYMPQNYEELLELEQTPIEYLDDSGDKERRTRIRTFLGALKYTADEMEHPISELSGGQQAKILLLKMSMSHVGVLLLDEPLRNFSPLSGPVIRRMLADFPGAIISISHDRKYIREVCDRVYRLTADGLVEEELSDGTPGQGDCGQAASR